MREKNGHFYKQTALIGVLTAISRVAGLLRDMACAALFGGGVVWDAFSFAFRIPNLFRRLFGEGAMSAASVPVFTEYIEKHGRQEASRLISTVATSVLLVLFACVLIGEVFFIGLPFIMPLSERWQLVFALSAVMLPYMLFICLAALAGSVLHSFRRFAVPASSPLVLNGCWIVAVVAVAPFISTNKHEQIFVVATAVLAAGVLQLLLHLIALRRRGINLRPVFSLKHPGARRIFSAMAPVALGMAAYQFNVLLDGVIAIGLSAPPDMESFNLFGVAVSYPMQAGANSALYFADRLMQFPLGIFGISLATAIFPVLSGHAVKKDRRAFSETLADGFGAVVFVAVPAGAGLVLVGLPAIRVLFQRHAFTADMTHRTYAILIAHSAGLWAYCGRHMLEKAFFARSNRITPVKVGLSAVGLNLVLNLTLIWFLAEVGLALATAICAGFQVVLLYRCMAIQYNVRPGIRLFHTFCKTTAASVAMSAVCLTVLHLLPPEPAGSRIFGDLLKVSSMVLAGASAYLVLAWILKVPELKLVLTKISAYLRKSE